MRLAEKSATINKANVSVSDRIALFDLGIAMVNYADESRLNKLYKLVEENIKVGSVHVSVSKVLLWKLVYSDDA